MLGSDAHRSVRAVPLFELTGVEKRYGELRALKDVDLSVEPGRIGLHGPNGAAKSPLLKALLGLVQHDHGTVKVFDKDVTREPFGVRALVGYMPEGDSVLPELTALQFTTLAAELCGLPRAEAIARSHQVLHYVGLGEARYRRLGSFSTGMRQRARCSTSLRAASTLASARRCSRTSSTSPSAPGRACCSRPTSSRTSRRPAIRSS